MLNLEQYTVLNEKRTAIENWVSVKPSPGLTNEWCQKMSNIYQSIYRVPVDYRCNSCLGTALKKILHFLVEYETEQKRLSKELQIKVDAEPEVKKKGREPKNWVRDEKDN